MVPSNHLNTTIQYNSLFLERSSCLPAVLLLPILLGGQGAGIGKKKSGKKCAKSPSEGRDWYGRHFSFLFPPPAGAPISGWWLFLFLHIAHTHSAGNIRMRSERKWPLKMARASAENDRNEGEGKKKLQTAGAVNRFHPSIVYCLYIYMQGIWTLVQDLQNILNSSVYIIIIKKVLFQRFKYWNGKKEDRLRWPCLTRPAGGRCKWPVQDRQLTNPNSKRDTAGWGPSPLMRMQRPIRLKSD